MLAAAIGSDWKGKLSPILYLIAICPYQKVHRNGLHISGRFPGKERDPRILLNLLNMIGKEAVKGGFKGSSAHLSPG
jgi:hypothetical protein